MPSEGAIALIFAGSIFCLLLLTKIACCIMDAIDRHIRDKEHAACKKQEVAESPTSVSERK